MTHLLLKKYLLLSSCWMKSFSGKSPLKFLSQISPLLLRRLKLYLVFFFFLSLTTSKTTSIKTLFRRYLSVTRCCRQKQPNRALAAAQLAEQLLLIQEVRGLNRVIGKNVIMKIRMFSVEKSKINQKGGPGIAHLKVAQYFPKLA